PNFLGSGGLPPSNAVSLPTTVADARAAVSAYSFDQIRPYSVNYTFSVSRTFHRDYVFEARYVGTKGVHLYVQDQLNRISNVTPSYSLPTYYSQPTAAQLSGLNLTLGQIQNNLVGLTHFPASPSNSWAQYGFTSTVTAYHPIGNSKY